MRSLPNERAWSAADSQAPFPNSELTAGTKGLSPGRESRFPGNYPVRRGAGANQVPSQIKVLAVLTFQFRDENRVRLKHKFECVQNFDRKA